MKEGYEAWGVRTPSGYVREFTTREKAALYAEKMEGKTVLQADGVTMVLWSGLTVVHRFIPNWETVDLEVGTTDA